MIHHLTLDRLEDNRAIFLTDDHQIVTLPTSLLPEELKPGQALYCELRTSLVGDQADEHLAKAVLNELLKTDE
jgi:hypothetical protein